MQEVPVAGNLQSDNGLALLTATLAGVGVALMPDWAVRDQLADGRLRRLLPQYRVSHIEFDNGVYAVYPEEHAHVREGACVHRFPCRDVQTSAALESQPTRRPPSTTSRIGVRPPRAHSSSM